MKNLKDIFKISAISKGKSLKLSFGDGPVSDWRVIIIDSFVLILISIVLNAIIFLKIDKKEVFVVEEAQEGEFVTLDIDLLKETVSHYESKRAEFEKVKRGGGSKAVPDPSV